MVHVVALQWLNCISARRLRASCHELYELGDAQMMIFESLLDLVRESGCNVECMLLALHPGNVEALRFCSEAEALQLKPRRMMHAEALQWLNCIFARRLRATCRQSYELGDTNKNAGPPPGQAKRPRAESCLAAVQTTVPRPVFFPGGDVFTVSSPNLTSQDFESRVSNPRAVAYFRFGMSCESRHLQGAGPIFPD